MSSVKRQGSHEDEGAERKKLHKSDKVDDGSYESDVELTEESIQDRLSWREEDRFSDYTIVITVNKKPRGDENAAGDSRAESIYYKVRMAILADGPRRSEYFVRLFDNDGNFSESQDKTSRIELSQLQANVFPYFLDYMYSAGHKMSFRTFTATALYSIAKYFGVKRLQIEAKKFCLQDMQNVNRCGTYFEHATILQAGSILEPAAKFCRDNIQQIDSNTSRLPHAPDPQFWLDLMKQHADNTSKLCALCGFIAAFCDNNADILSPEIFKQLTAEEYLPDYLIHPFSARQLLDSERRIIGINDEQQEGEGGELSNLQIRCVKAIAGGKKEELGNLKNYKQWTRDVIKQLSPSVQTEIILRCLIPE